MDEKEFTPFKSSPLLPIFEKFSKTRDVSLVYGDPIEMHGRTIIPVAQVKYSVGAGAGGGNGRGEPNSQSDSPAEMGSGHGEGAGGSFQIKPVGIYDITTEKSIYRPIAPVELIVLLPLMLTGLVFLLTSSKNKDVRIDFSKTDRLRNGSRCQNKGTNMKKKWREHND